MRWIALLALTAQALHGPLAAAAPNPQRARRLWLSSRPAGAAVFVNGRLLGATPVRGAAIGAGKAQLVVFKPGHRPWRLPVGAGVAPLRLGPVTLQPDGAPPAGPAGRLPGKGTASLLVSAVERGRPIAARVFLDGRAVGQTPLQLKRLPPGRHVIEVRRPGTGRATRTVVLQPHRAAKVVLTLAAPPRSAAPARQGRLQVTALVGREPVDAQVYLDGKLVGRTPLSAPVAIGSHQLVVRNPGYAPVRRVVQVVLRRSTRVAVQLVRVGR